MMTSRTNLKSSGSMNSIQDSTVLFRLSITGGRIPRRLGRRLLEGHVSLNDLESTIHVQFTIIHVKCVTSFFILSKKKHGKYIFCSKSCSHAYDKSLKMDTLDYNKVKDLYESGVTQVKIAKMFGVSNATVSKFMRDNGISTGYKRHDPGLKRKSRKTSNADVV